MNIKSAQSLVAEALKEIKTIDADQAFKMVEDNNCNLIDIRDVRELEKEGRIWSRRDGRLLIFFADSVPTASSFSSPLLDINFSKNSIKRSILMHLNQADLMDLAGPSGSELARDIGISPQVLSYHVRSLIDWEMVERRRFGLKVSLSITELGIEALTGIDIEVEQ